MTLMKATATTVFLHGYFTGSDQSRSNQICMTLMVYVTISVYMESIVSSLFPMKTDT